MMNQFGLMYEKVVGKWIYYATTLFLLGYFIFPTTKLHNLFLYVGLCVPVILILPVVYKSIRPSNWILVSMLGLAAYLFLNSLWSIHYSSAQSLKYFGYLLGLYCLVGGVCYSQARVPDYSEYLLKAFIVIGSLHYMYGIWGHFQEFEEPLAHRYSYRPIDEAIFAGMLFLMSLWVIVDQSQWWRRLAILGLAIPFVLVMLLSKSRGPQLALLLSLPLFAYFRGMKIRHFVLMALALLMVMASVLFFTGTAKQLFSRGLEFPYRVDIWMISLREGFEYFWFGQGMSEQAPIFVDGNKFNHSHNIVLSIFRMGGITGVVLFALNFVLCLWVGLKQEKPVTKLWVLLLFFGVVCLMTNGRYPLTRHTSIWFAYWIPIAFIAANATSFKISFPSKQSAGR